MSTQPKYRVAPPAGTCSVSGRTLEEGEPFFTVLFEEGDSFRRADYSAEAWNGAPEGCFCFFKSTVPVQAKKKRLLVDDELLVAFFMRLAEEEELVRVQFRFVLALILMRKRILRYEDTGVDGEVETWRMSLLRDGSVHNVVNPQLTDAQISDVSGQLNAILHADAAEWLESGDSAQDDS